MEQFFDTIIELLEDLFTLALEFFTDIGKVAKLLADTALQVPQYLTIFFPADVAIVLVTGVSIVIIYKVAGRS